MKIFKLSGDGKKYVVLRDCGALQPFSKESLVLQIMKVVEEIPRGEGVPRIVFSKEEEAAITTLSEQVVGGLEVNQGLGHGLRGVDLLLAPLLRPAGLHVTYTPTADADEGKPIAEVQGWSLSIQVGT